MKRVIILGGGLAGLSTAWKLSEDGFEVSVIEAEPQVGGLAKTLHRKDYSCDLGPHRFISSKKDIFQEIKSLLGENLLQTQRRSKIWIKGRCLEYPLNLKDVFLNFNLRLSFKMVIEYLAISIRNKVSPRPDDSFESWAINRFGKTFYSIYFKDYTAKLWHLPPATISVDWAVQRISIINLGEVMKRLFLKKKKVPRTYLNTFYYPINGIGEIADKMAERIRNNGGQIYLNSQVKKITVESRKVTLITFAREGGKDISIKADYVVSTIPVANLACMITDNSRIIKAASNLKSLSLVYLFLLIKRPRVSNNHWLYFPEKRYIFNRISEIKSFSPDMVPHDKTVLCIEIACIRGDEVWNLDSNNIFDKIKNGLLDIGLVELKDIEDIFMHREENAYPIYDLKYKDNLKLVLNYIDSLNNLITIGRQGLFRYNNMDHSIEMGFRTANYLSGKDSKKGIYTVGIKSEFFG